MNQKNFDRKQRYGIRKFAVGVASVTIGAVVFGVNPVLANEQGNSTVTAAEIIIKVYQNYQKKLLQEVLQI